MKNIFANFFSHWAGVNQPGGIPGDPGPPKVIDASPNVFKDAIHQRLFNERPFGTSLGTLGRLHQVLRDNLTPGKKKLFGRHQTNFSRIGCEGDNRFRLHLGLSHSVVRTQREIELHILLQSQLGEVGALARHERPDAILRRGFAADTDNSKPATQFSTGREQPARSERPTQRTPRGSVAINASAGSRAEKVQPDDAHRIFRSSPNSGVASTFSQAAADSSARAPGPDSPGLTGSAGIAAAATGASTATVGANSHATTGVSVATAGAGAARESNLAGVSRPSAVANEVPAVAVPDEPPMVRPDFQPLIGPKINARPGLEEMHLPRGLIDLERIHSNLMETTHIQKEISNVNGGAWWRSAWAAAIRQHGRHGAGLEQLIVNKLGQDHAADARAVRTMAEDSHEHGIDRIFTGINLACLKYEVEKVPSQLRLHGFDPIDVAEGVETHGDQICKSLTALLLKRAGAEESVVLACLAGNQTPDFSLIALLLNELDADAVVFEPPVNARAVNDQAGVSGPAGRIRICPRPDSGQPDPSERWKERWSGVKFNPNQQSCTQQLSNSLDGMPVLINNNGKITIALPRGLWMTNFATVSGA